MRKFSFFTILICTVLLLAQASIAQTFDPTLGALGARPLSMGRAFIGLADDTNTLFFNPAGLATLDNQWSATSMYTKLLETVDYRMLGGTYNTEYGSFGLGYVGTSNPAGYRTGTTSDEVYEKMSFDTHTFLISYGNEMGNLIEVEGLPKGTYVGADVKLVMEGLTGSGDRSGFGINLDVGALAKLTPWAQAGLTLNNLIPGTMQWTSGLSEDMPMEMNLGGAFNLMGPEGISLYKGEQTLVGVFDAKMGLSVAEGFTLHGGLEWQPMEYVKVRCGIDQNNISISEGNVGSALNLTAGVGFSYQGITFDYAYFQDSNLEANQNHYFSISYSPIITKTTVAEKPKKTKKRSIFDDDDDIIIFGDEEADAEDDEIIIEEDNDDDLFIIDDGSDDMPIIL